MVRFEPPISAPAVPEVVSGELIVSEVVAVPYRRPEEFAFTVPVVRAVLRIAPVNVVEAERTKKAVALGSYQNSAVVVAVEPITRMSVALLA
jgi:hypothetical protein